MHCSQLWPKCLYLDIGSWSSYGLLHGYKRLAIYRKNCQQNSYSLILDFSGKNMFAIYLRGNNGIILCAFEDCMHYLSFLPSSIVMWTDAKRGLFVFRVKGPIWENQICIFIKEIFSIKTRYLDNQKRETLY